MIWQIDDAARAIEGLDEHGRPLPAYAASLGLVPARPAQRVVALVCEAAIAAALQLPLLIGALPTLLRLVEAPAAAAQGLFPAVLFAAASAFLSTAFIVLQLVLQGRLGVTVGKALAGVRMVNARTLERPGFWRGAVVRYLVLVGSFVVPVAGPLVVVALSPLFDPERRGRGWPDLAAATWLVDVRRGLNPYDAKRMRIARKTAATELTDVVAALPSLATDAAASVFPVARSTGGVIGAPHAAASGAAPSAPQPAAPEGAPPAATPAGFAPGTTVDAPAPPSAWAPPVLLPDASAPAQPAASGPPAPPAELVLDSGECIAVTGAGVLIGRGPRDADRSGLVPTAVADDTKSVSKTHFAVVRTAGGFAVADWGSTNGSAIVRAGAQHELLPGRQTALRDGDEIRFGDRTAHVRLTGAE